MIKQSDILAPFDGNVIEIMNVSKSYASVEALKDVSLEVQKGDLFGIIGPDGAGKTTLFRILTTLLIADKGSVLVNGLDVVREYKKIRSQVGYMPGRFSLYPDLSVKENLQFFASVFGTTIHENYHLIEDVYKRLEPFSDRKASQLSGGMKQKLALCCALIHAPSVLLLDEPTTGVDPSSRREFWEMLARLKQFGITILVSTAYMDEAARCEKIAMMSEGRFLVVDSPKNIVANYDKVLLAIRSDEMYRLLQDLRQIPEIEKCYTFGDVHHVTLAANSPVSPKDIEQSLKDRFQHVNVSVNPCPASMEDCFINLEER